MSSFPTQNEMHRKKGFGVNDLEGGEIQIERSIIESPTHNQGMQKTLS